MRPDRRAERPGIVILFAAAAFLSCAPASAQGRGCREAGLAPVASETGRPLTIQFFGVSTLLFDDGDHRLLIDGFFSRPETVLGRLRSDQDLVARQLGGETPLSALLVAHGHHDHALDLEAVAKAAQQAIIVGPPAVAKLALARGVSPDRVCMVGAGRSKPMRYGSFRVTAFEVPHGDSPFYLRWLLDHPPGRAALDGDRFWRFKDNENRSYLVEHGELKILVHPSAGVADLSGQGAQVVFLGMGRLGVRSPSRARSYLTNVLGSHPQVVVPVHWDRFDRPLGARLEYPPRLVDDVPRGFRRLCAYAAPRALVVRRMEALSVLEVRPDGAVRGVSGDIRDGCAQTANPREHSPFHHRPPPPLGDLIDGQELFVGDGFDSHRSR
jgi:L-ascorbate metabolism protein UlaG (beta-lactamase superfamily)